MAENVVIDSGSAAEGQYEAKYCSPLSNPELDKMIFRGEAHKPEQLLPNLQSPAFVQIELDQTDLKNIDLPILLTSTNKLCIDGMQLKKQLLNELTLKFLHVDFETSIEKASIQGKVNYVCKPEHILINLELFRISFSQSHLFNQQRDYIRQWLINVPNTIVTLLEKKLEQIPSYIKSDLLKTIKNAFQIAFQLFGTSFGQAFQEQVLNDKILAVLQYHEKHKHLVNTTSEKYNSLKRLFTRQVEPEIDYVPYLKLTFTPDIIQPFLNRFKSNRPNLFDKIKCLPVYLIPKWSRTVSLETEEAKLDFRYSFSAYETEIAQRRSKVEQVLNNVARGLYYKYLNKNLIVDQQYLPSYFIKTSVL
ncbi:unnamed protein product [Didymodactylos carnosus]|uniref:Uncharacterized protein n=1 Tax=Didymodactylos carnosus TaxID=1234261 RepID=A0A814X5Q9_9BILA|nr:unnamed protein product [Didymodactylos carnosus]CAF1211799.1 unnamed protein product [Didymodactylos carnosus]CAF3800085.1 unnamed protein product [Didymodactylos carnosus]CAF3975737.1 unnamed protein product [Didymodactylos carnosus]